MEEAIARKALKDWIKKFAFLTEEDCLLFEPYLRVRIYPQKALFLEEGKVCSEIGFIVKGCFRVYYLSEGKEINIHFAFEEEFITEYGSFLQGEPSRYFIQAMEEAQIVAFSASALQRIYGQSHNWERFGRIMAEQSYQLAKQRTESFLFLNGEQRYLDLLERKPNVFERVPLYHIASYLGLERESLSRLRRKITRRSKL